MKVSRQNRVKETIWLHTTDFYLFLFCKLCLIIEAKIIKLYDAVLNEYTGNTIILQREE